MKKTFFVLTAFVCLALSACSSTGKLNKQADFCYQGPDINYDTSPYDDGAGVDSLPCDGTSASKLREQRASGKRAK